MPELPEGESLYEEFFTLREKESGNPMPYAQYRVETAEGEVITGRCDGEGRTQKILTRRPQDMKVTSVDPLDDTAGGEA